MNSKPIFMWSIEITHCEYKFNGLLESVSNYFKLNATPKSRLIAQPKFWWEVKVFTFGEVLEDDSSETSEAALLRGVSSWLLSILRTLEIKACRSGTLREYFILLSLMFGVEGSLLDCTKFPWIFSQYTQHFYHNIFLETTQKIFTFFISWWCINEW